MSLVSSYPGFSTLAAILVVVFCSGSAQAGWVTIKNDTTKPLVIQENVTVNGQVKRGKPINLLPGETLREYLPGPAVKKIEVFETENRNQPVWSGALNCNDERQTFSVTSSKDKVSVDQLHCPCKK